MKRFIMVWGLLAFAGTMVFGLGLETSALAARVETLYRSAGRAMPTVSIPVSTNELHHALKLLLAADLTDELREEAGELDRVLTELVGTGEISAQISASPEYYHNVDRSEFTRQVIRENPFAELGLGYGYYGGPYLFAQAALQREWSYSTSATNIPSPQPGNPVPFENNLLRTGYVYFPAGLADITFGRQQIAIGPDSSNSLMVSSRVPFLDALKVTMSLGNLKMTALTSTLDNGRAVPDTAGTAIPLSYDFNINTILYNIHYFEYAWPRVRLGIGSQVLLARQMNNFQLGDFFPVFTWHNADIVPNNMCLLMDVTYVPAPNVELFAQLGFDDISGESVGVADSGVPTIDAYIAGVAVEFSGLNLSASATGGYTHYLWGNFDLTDFLARAIYRIESDGSHKSMPLTSTYGPGALWMDTQVTWGWQDFNGSLSYIALGKTPGANPYSTAYESSAALEDAAREWTHTISLGLSYDILEWANVTVIPGVTITGGAPEFQLEASGRVWKRFSRAID
ncbi:MAG: hypothetical protein E4H09_04160 [Spirochaetales bacterium]|nr:MAG: hypothetical protein E4H09_04160 [Spirochaetales bacterium]